VPEPADILTRGGVTLRRWRPPDADAVLDLVMASMEHLSPWMPWVAGYDRAAAVGYLTRCQTDWDADAAYNYAIQAGGVLAGSCSLMRRGGPGRAEIGYWLHPARVRQGTATAAAALLVEQAFALPGVDRVEIVHDKANARSEAVPRRLGFTRIMERTPPQEPVTAGEVGVDVVWRLTRR
jgi:ribosomal-protein-serine acetyltransferase